jgi:hypothetical protein
MTDSKGPPISTARRPADPPLAPRPALPRARVPSGRHAAITRDLQNYASYKSWAERMRNNWVPGKGSGS